jgi:hypothetical protein
MALYLRHGNWAEYGPPLAYSAEELRRLKFYTLPKSRRLRETIAALARELDGFVYSDEELKTKKAFREADHPRGQPDNPGQFVEKDKQTAAPDTEAKHKGTAAGQKQADPPEKEAIPEVPYKNHAEFAGAMASKFNTGNNGFEVSRNIQDQNLNIPALTQSVTGIENMVNTFPALKNSLTRLDVAYGNDILMSTSLEGAVYFKDKSYKSYPDAINTSVDSRTVSGRIKSGKERLVSAGEHEAAHLIERELIYRNKKYTNDKERRNAWKLNLEAAKVIDEAYELAKNEPDLKGRSRDELIADISRYAIEDKSECLAEGITDYQYNSRQNNTGQAKLLSRMIYKVIQKRLGG